MPGCGKPVGTIAFPAIEDRPDPGPPAAAAAAVAATVATAAAAVISSTISVSRIFQ